MSGRLAGKVAIVAGAGTSGAVMGNGQETAILFVLHRAGIDLRADDRAAHGRRDPPQAPRGRRAGHDAGILVMSPTTNVRLAQRKF